MSAEDFLTRNITGLTSALESMVLNEELSHTRGFIQTLDPRVKVFSSVLLIVVAGLARNLWILGTLFVLILIFDALARIPLPFFVKRVLLFLPLTAIIALPALFITPGDPLAQIGSRTIITVQGGRTAAFLMLRVLDSVSLGLLLILTTPWNGILLALRWFHLPSIVIDVLGMTYRYIFLFLHTAESMFMARRSRSLGEFSGVENRRWLSRALGVTLAKTQHLSEEVYLAMLARGYEGQIFTLHQLRFRGRDYVWLGLIAAISIILIWSTYR